MGSLVLFDPSVGTEGSAPITRLTPEVPFPEIEAWSETNFANPWPLSERMHLVSWGKEGSIAQWQKGRAANGMGIYLFDAECDLEMLYRDATIASSYPIPIRSRTRPPILPDRTDPDGAKEGRFLLVDVYRGLKKTQRGEIKALRIVAVPGKTHPTMNYPVMGLTRDDPGKCVLGTVPVEEDGSAHFRVPAGVIVFFQALDARGMAVQTMRSSTHVQPGQTLSCIGCHESRDQAPPQKHKVALAAMREPSKITVGPPGSWPLRFDHLVQPVLDKKCVSCHNPKSKDKNASPLDLTAAKAYASLFGAGKPSLKDHVMARYKRGISVEDGCPASSSPIIKELLDPKGHHDVTLDADSLDRLITWMDTYGQRLGSFSDRQERELLDFRKRCQTLLIEKTPGPVVGQLQPGGRLASP
jgi:cytochrome c553